MEATISLTKRLTEEHKLIKRIIDVLEIAIKNLEKKKQVNPHLFEQATDFIRNFADKFHHAKEEEILFKEMVKKGMPEKDSPIEAMLIEHEQGRGFVRGIVMANGKFKRGSKEAVNEVINNARGYIELLREHIDKEENILYPLAERILGGEHGRINKEFHAAELRKGGNKTVKKYHEMVISLEKNLKKNRGLSPTLKGKDHSIFSILKNPMDFLELKN